MSDIYPFLKSMISLSGISGFEHPVADIIEKQWAPISDSLSRSRLGSIHALRAGSLPVPQQRPALLVAAHMDAIGLMVSRIVDGFLYVTALGGIDPRVLPGTPVTIHASNSGAEYYGVVVLPPADLLPQEKSSGVIGLHFLLVDVGLTAGQVVRHISVGDRVSFATDPVEFSGDWLSGHSLDNRASLAALTICLEELSHKKHAWDFWAVASTQEEMTAAGAVTSAFHLRPQIAIALDVTFGTGPGANGYESFALGKGLTLGVGPTNHPFLYQRMSAVARALEIPVFDEPMPESSSTDADRMQLVADGIPTLVLSIPLRYMHTPVELVAFKDIQRAGRLLAGFVTSLEPDFMDTMVWD